MTGPPAPRESSTAGVLVLDVQDTRFDSSETYLRFVEDEAKRDSPGGASGSSNAVRHQAGGTGPTLPVP